MGFREDRRLDEEYIMPTFKRYDVEFVKGEGMHLYDSEGKRYIDFLSGIGVCSLGHCHPDVVEAVKGQAESLIHVSNYFYIENRAQVAEKLSDMLARTYDATSLPENATIWKTFFANSGAEANECAIKLARIAHDSEADGQPVIVSLEKSFHGRTLASLVSTGQPALQEGFAPMPEGFVYTPRNDIASLENVFGTYGRRICAVIVECIQGESGVNTCDEDFLKAIRRLCDDSDALMICDEVQSGIFRTGRPFAFQHFRIVPDIVTMAKGIASGVPAAACSARAEIADLMGPGKHGSTFGGSNLAMSAAAATLEALDKDDVCANVTDAGEYLRARLSEIPCVVDVRGIGLMVGAQLAEGIDAHKVVAEALRKGAVLNATGPSTLRMLPPLICTRSDVDEFIDILTDTLD